MKYSQMLMLTAALVLPGFGVWSGSAQDLFKAQVETTAVVTNDSGGLSYSHYGNRQILREAADAAGLTNLFGLRLVYNKTNDNLEVVMGTNNVVIATPMTFNGGVSLSKTNNTVVERLAWVFLGTNATAAGTLRATEHSHFNTSNELTHFALIGRLQFAQPAEGTNGATVYSGTISAVSPFHHHGDHDHDHDD
jgi:hypothetical protein